MTATRSAPPERGRLPRHMRRAAVRLGFASFRASFRDGAAACGLLDGAARPLAGLARRHIMTLGSRTLLACATWISVGSLGCVSEEVPPHLLTRAEKLADDTRGE